MREYFCFNFPFTNSSLILPLSVLFALWNPAGTRPPSAEENYTLLFGATGLNHCSVQTAHQQSLGGSEGRRFFLLPTNCFQNNHPEEAKHRETFAFRRFNEPNVHTSPPPAGSRQHQLPCFTCQSLFFPEFSTNHSF